MINKEIFWEIIDACRQYTEFRKDDLDLEIVDIQDTYIDYLKGALSTYSIEDVFVFGEIFSYYSLKLYRDDIWNWLIKQDLPASDDCFFYFRNWVISLGYDAYMECFSHPNILDDYLDEVVDSDSIYFDKLGNVTKEVIEERLDCPTGRLKTMCSNACKSIYEELKKLILEDTEYGPIKRGLEAMNKEKSENNSENEENVKTINVHGKSSLYSQNDRLHGREYLLSLYKNKDGEIEVECNENCENCPMELFGEKCE